MARYRKPFLLFFFGLMLCAAALGYHFWQRANASVFTCQASFVQHHPDQILTLWLNYNFNGDSGVLSMNGTVKNDDSKIINRKIAFRINREGDTFALQSIRNIKFPDDTVSNEWLARYEPDFFVYPDKNIYLRMHKQRNGNFLFVFDVLPTYVCRQRDGR